MLGNGNTRSGTRLNVCPIIKNMSLEQRGRLLLGDNGCQLCLYWIGGHTKENCVDKNKFSKIVLAQYLPLSVGF